MKGLTILETKEKLSSDNELTVLTGYNFAIPHFGGFAVATQKKKDSEIVPAFYIYNSVIT
jgi:hypothetical protein